jgi:transposase
LRAGTDGRHAGTSKGQRRSSRSCAAASSRGLAVIDKLTHENAVLKRLKFAAKSEAHSAEQKSLLEKTLDSDLASVATEIVSMQPTAKAAGEKQAPKREKVPAALPRREIRHEPENATCGCGTPMHRIGEVEAEKLDYQPGVFTVERHIRGK